MGRLSLNRDLSKKDTVEYPTSEELEGQEVDSPVDALASALVDLDSKDWKLQCSSLHLLRRLIINHADLFGDIKAVNSMSVRLDTLCGDLRSTVVRNALLCISDMAMELAAKVVDSVLPILLPGMLRRAGGTDQFLKEGAEQATQALICYSSTNKSMPVLVRCALEKGKGVVMRTAAASSLELIVSTEARGRKLVTSKHYPLLLQCLAVLQADSNGETRRLAKNTLFALASYQGEAGLERALQAAAVSKADVRSIMALFRQ
jgi:hypothetical protein